MWYVGWSAVLLITYLVCSDFQKKKPAKKSKGQDSSAQSDDFSGMPDFLGFKKPDSHPYDYSSNPYEGINHGGDADGGEGDD